ncbi:MAG: hypothetical protein Q7I99_08440 [Acholeplasmataceae bacterium]|nr:hypothetical protein [Acholeplasmataceae bacterium]
MNPNDYKDDKDPNKLTEEELLELLEELKKRKKSKGVSVTLGFMLHKNYVIHMILSLSINILIAAVVFGLGIGINQPFVNMTVVGFMLAIILLTLVENYVKILMFKYAARAMILSMGLLNVMAQIIIWYAIDMLLVQGFHFINIESLIIFAFVFSAFRLVISIYLRKWIYSEKLVFFGGKK